MTPSSRGVCSARHFVALATVTTFIVFLWLSVPPPVLYFFWLGPTSGGTDAALAYKWDGRGNIKIGEAPMEG